VRFVWRGSPCRPAGQRNVLHSRTTFVRYSFFEVTLKARSDGFGLCRNRSARGRCLNGMLRSTRLDWPLCVLYLLKSGVCESSFHPHQALRAGMMWFRHLAMVLLAAGLLLVPSTIGVGTVEHPVRDGSSPVVRSTRRQAVSPFVSRSTAVSSFSLFRCRLKSVLEETNPRVVVESDLGPVSIPNHFIRLMGSGPGVHSRLTKLPLRC